MYSHIRKKSVQLVDLMLFGHQQMKLEQFVLRKIQMKPNYSKAKKLIENVFSYIVATNDQSDMTQSEFLEEF